MPRPPAAAPSADLPAGCSESLQRLARRGALRHYRKGVLLIQEGDRGDTLYVLVRGRVRVFSGDDPHHELTHGIYGPGEYVGEMSLDGGPRSASVMTLDACTCSVVTREALLRHIAEEPGFALELLAGLVQRARTATLSARQLALSDVYGRLKALLEAAALPQQDGLRRIPQRPTHLDVATRLGCSREMVSRLLKDLQRGGYLSVQGDAWVLHRPLPARW